ncbi:hypothetical protein OZD61_05825, partial [Wolbachia endosymbiont of Drosophila bocki]|nr:hypothetical protein [Wolbachia endosymbiont of Drosophila bocki]MDE5067516.1 hypothetical protein [Wolbachia endosymbiont of Drosophila leontia]
HFGLPTCCYPSYGTPTFIPVGLTSTEHTHLLWTHIGKIQKTRRGSKVGKHEFIGGFAAVMPKGNSGIFKREGRAALPIQEVKLPLKPEGSRIIKDLVDYESERVFEKYFKHELNYILKI